MQEFLKKLKNWKISGLIIILIVFLFFISINLKIQEHIMKGKVSLKTGDSFSFLGEIIHSNNLSNEVNSGDVLLSGFDYMPPYPKFAFGPPEKSYYLHKVNALGLYDAGNNIHVDCESVKYDKDKILLLRGGTQFEANRSVCVKTKEGMSAKMIYQTPGSFEWESYTYRLEFTKGNVAGLTMQYAQIEGEILNRFESGEEFVPVSIVFKEFPEIQNNNSKIRKSLIDQRLDYFLSTLTEDDFIFKYKYYFIFPGLAGKISSQGLKKIRENPNVQAIYFDSYFKPILTESVPLISADEIWNVKINDINLTGNSVGVCIIDSGIDDTHPDLEGRILDQHCFCSNNCCPGGEIENDNASDYNGHGTYVSGIVAANGVLKGVAPGSNIIAVKVYNSTFGSSTDAQKGIDWCIENRNAYNISIIVLSIAKTDENKHEIIYTSVCDDEDLIVNAANNATNYGIFSVAGSGNSGSQVGITSPACGSNVSSVGAFFDQYMNNHSWMLNESDYCSDSPTNADYICCGGNRASILDILAPGSLITSTWISGSGYDTQYGTSASAPHVAGVAALLIQHEKLKNNRTLTASEINNRFKETGKFVFDSGQNSSNGGTNLTYIRIDAYSAVFPISVYDLKRIKASNIHNVFSFIIKNNYNNKTKDVLWSFDIGKGTKVNSTSNITLPPKSTSFVYFENNYTDGDIYQIEATATSGDDNDSETMTLTMGDIIAHDLREIYTNGNERIFNFRILNNMNLSQTINWTLYNEDVNVWSKNLTMLNTGKDSIIYVHYNFSSGGPYAVFGNAFNKNISDITNVLNITVPS